jgi:hypothetical protein
VVNVQFCFGEAGDETFRDRHEGQSRRAAQRALRQAQGTCAGLRARAQAQTHMRAELVEARLAYLADQAKRRAEASCSASRRRARIKGSIRTVPNTTYRTAAVGESVGTLAISNSAIWRMWSA